MSLVGNKWVAFAALAAGFVSSVGAQDHSLSGGSSGGSGGSSSSCSDTECFENEHYARYLIVSLCSVVVALTVYRLVLSGARYIRLLTCLGNDTQMYFQKPVAWFGKMKQHLLYAPLFRTRHMEEIHLARWWSIGILPTRFQSLFLTGIIALNVALCFNGIQWSQAGTKEGQAMVLAHFRNRSGILSIVNMIPLVIMAGRNNPLIVLLNLPYDTFNLMHRWFGRIVVVEAVAHTVAWTINKVQTSGWKGVQGALQRSQLITTGFIAILAFLVLVVQASAAMRHAFYELFLHMHILLVILSIITLWVHLEGLPQQIYIKLVVAAWVLERSIRLLSLLYRNLSSTPTTATIEALPGDALRLTLHVARPWTFHPGQHTFLTIPSIGLWTSHPFSLAWSSTTPDLSPEKGLIMSRQDINSTLPSAPKTTFSAIIRRRSGFTDRLYRKAEAAHEGRLVVRAFAEGPYGGLHSLASYGTVVLFAGGVGITHQVPYIRSLVEGFAHRTVAARRVLLVWVIQAPEHLEWIRPWMSEILALDRRRDVLRIQLFVTRPRSSKEIHSPSATVQMFPGRPNVETVVGMECDRRVGAMVVGVCGTGGLADEVRRAVRRRQGVGVVDLVEESYSW